MSAKSAKSEWESAEDVAIVAPIISTPVKAIRSIDSPEKARDALGLTPKQMGERLAVAIGRRAGNRETGCIKAFDRTTIEHLENNPERMTPKMRNAYLHVLDSVIKRINPNWRVNKIKEKSKCESAIRKSRGLLAKSKSNKSRPYFEKFVFSVWCGDEEIMEDTK